MKYDGYNINRQNAIDIINKLDNFFINKEMKSAEIKIPKSVIGNSNEFVLYVFYACLLNYGMKSSIYNYNIYNTYINCPNIFNPKYICDNYINDTETLLHIIKQNIHPRFPNVALNKWIELSIYLNNNYSGNIINHIKKYNNYDELYQFIRNIKGYGQKTGSLLVRILYESNICQFDSNISTIPIDRHDIEISILNNVITVDTKINESIMEKLSSLYVEIGNELNISPSNIDKYLWIIGSEYCNNKACDNCPLKMTCKKEITKNKVINF